MILLKKKNIQLIKFKLRAVHSLYILKIFFFLKKTLNFFFFNYSFYPSKTKKMVILKSPFIYKHSKLKFKFKIFSANLSLKLLTLNKEVINFFLKYLNLILFKKLLIYKLKKKTINYLF